MARETYTLPDRREGMWWIGCLGVSSLKAHSDPFDALAELPENAAVEINGNTVTMEWPYWLRGWGPPTLDDLDVQLDWIKYETKDKIGTVGEVAIAALQNDLLDVRQTYEAAFRALKSKNKKFFKAAKARMLN